MILIFSSSKFDKLIRDAEGRPDLSADELQLKFKQYTDRLWQHVAGFGVKFAGLVGMQGSLASIRFNLSGHNPDEIFEGLRFLQPVSVVVEEFDVPALIQNPVARASMRDNFYAIAPQLSNIELHEVREALDKAYLQLVNSPAGPVEMTEPFELWAQRHGLRVPRNVLTEREAANEAAETAAAEKREQWWQERETANESGSWGVKE